MYLGKKQTAIVPNAFHYHPNQNIHLKQQNIFVGINLNKYFNSWSEWYFEIFFLEDLMLSDIF